MAKKKADINKSQLIRDYIAANLNYCPKAITAALKMKGIKVSELLVGAINFKLKV